jgi:hypothetical protein
MPSTRPSETGEPRRTARIGGGSASTDLYTAFLLDNLFTFEEDDISAGNALAVLFADLGDQAGEQA